MNLLTCPQAVWPLAILPGWRPGVPLLSVEVRAGFPSPADSHVEEAVNLHARLVPRPASTYLLRVAGVSMEGRGPGVVSDGDLVVVDRSVDPRDGHLVVVELDGGFCLKVLRRRAGRVWLQPANANFADIEVTPERELRVCGVVTARISEFAV